MEEFLQSALEANRKIYEEINSGFRSEWLDYLQTKGAGGDISSKLDIFAEDIFIKHLKSFGQIISEEIGIYGSGDKKIIIDPIDGSSNATSFYPYFGSSVALQNENQEIEAAVVCNFANGDIFYKIKNEPLMYGNFNKKGFKEEKSIALSKIGLFERSYSYGEIVKRLFEKKLKYRAPGAVALSLAYAHRVKFVLYLGDIRIYDVTAGLFFCEDLKVKIAKNYVIVAKEIEVLETIENIIKEVKDEFK
ncbi:MAG: inositol monophosphatase [Epsilonproteobacteria bacterium]|nr:inositol monophosphatase [Campylobacterota bacterium]